MLIIRCCHYFLRRWKHVILVLYPCDFPANPTPYKYPPGSSPGFPPIASVKARCRPAPSNPLTDSRHRPPARRGYHTTDAPLIVTPIFLTRADDTSRAVRPMDPGSTRGRHGEAIENPDAEPAEIALEAAPNLAYEHWDKYWRKVHGPKFAYEEPGTNNEPVVRDPHAQVPAYQRPRFDGFAYIAYAAEADINRVLKQPQYAERIIQHNRTDL